MPAGQGRVQLQHQPRDGGCLPKGPREPHQSEVDPGDLLPGQPVVLQGLRRQEHPGHLQPGPGGHGRGQAEALPDREQVLDERGRRGRHVPSARDSGTHPVLRARGRPE